MLLQHRKINMNYQNISKHIPLQVMQNIMSKNSNVYTQRNNEKIVCEYAGPNTITGYRNKENYAVYTINGSHTKSFDSVVLCVKCWDPELSTRTQDREYIRWAISERTKGE